MSCDKLSEKRNRQRGASRYPRTYGGILPGPSELASQLLGNALQELFELNLFSRGERR